MGNTIPLKLLSKFFDRGFITIYEKPWPEYGKVIKVKGKAEDLIRLETELLKAGEIKESEMDQYFVDIHDLSCLVIGENGKVCLHINKLYLVDEDNEENAEWLNKIYFDEFEKNIK